MEEKISTRQGVSSCRRKGGSGKKTLAAVVAVLVVVAAVALYPYFLAGAPEGGTIYVRPGTSLEALHDSIARHIGEPYAGRVVKLLSWSKARIAERHGAFVVTKGESAARLARQLHGGASSSIRFTFNNLRTKEEWIEKAGSLYECGPEAFRRALNDPKLCAKYGKTPDNIINILIPDTYDFYWDVTPEKMLNRMYDYYNNFWNSDRKAKAQKLGLTPDQVEIIASITEEETVKPDERGKVGRLYINRFKAGMRLQADPTVKYAIGDFSIKRLTDAMLMTKSPYNTYRVNGLPPGPIRLPEKSTIDAILNSKPHSYMYMCARPDFSGYHDFTSNYQEHLSYAHKYQQELNKRNIE